MSEIHILSKTASKRKFIPSRPIKVGKRMCENRNPHLRMYVTSVGEVAIDSGGCVRKLWQRLAQVLSKTYFYGFNLRQSTSALEPGPKSPTSGTKTNCACSQTGCSVIQSRNRSTDSSTRCPGHSRRKPLCKSVRRN